MYRDKTGECLWCGLSEAHGARLAARRAGKLECVDLVVCNARIKVRIATGPLPRP